VATLGQHSPAPGIRHSNNEIWSNNDFLVLWTSNLHQHMCAFCALDAWFLRSLYESLARCAVCAQTSTSGLMISIHAQRMFHSAAEGNHGSRKVYRGQVVSRLPQGFCSQHHSTRHSPTNHIKATLELHNPTPAFGFSSNQLIDEMGPCSCNGPNSCGCGEACKCKACGVSAHSVESRSRGRR
jgi:hypothetical protein